MYSLYISEEINLPKESTKENNYIQSRIVMYVSKRKR